MRFITALAAVVAVPLSAQDVPADEFWPLPDAATFGSPASNADARAVESLIARFTQAWGTEDVDGLLATFAPDVEWTNAYGVIQRGHADLGAFLTELFGFFDAAAAAEESARGTLVSTRYVGDDAAVVHRVTESGRTANRDGAGLRRIHVTYVLEKREGVWLIVHQMIMDARL